MPLVRISLRKGRTAEAVRAISDGVHEAMGATINVPPDDRFQLISEHDAGGLVYDAAYLGVARTDALVVIQITLNAGRTFEMKRALYARIAENLEKGAAVRKEDVLINLVEVPKENWSFGNGLASYAS